jgi:hypothetical protein
MKKQESLEKQISMWVKVKMFMIESHQKEIDKIDRKISTLILESMKENKGLVNDCSSSLEKAQIKRK